jgi:hypothetical protein
MAGQVALDDEGKVIGIGDYEHRQDRFLKTSNEQWKPLVGLWTT